MISETFRCTANGGFLIADMLREHFESCVALTHDVGEDGKRMTAGGPQVDGFAPLAAEVRALPAGWRESADALFVEAARLAALRADAMQAHRLPAEKRDAIIDGLDDLASKLIRRMHAVAPALVDQWITGGDGKAHLDDALEAYGTRTLHSARTGYSHEASRKGHATGTRGENHPGEQDDNNRARAAISGGRGVDEDAIVDAALEAAGL